MEGLIALLIFLVPLMGAPGPGIIIIISGALNYGFRHMLPFVLGLSCGFSLAIVIVGPLIAALLERVPRLKPFIVLPMLVFVLYLAFKLWNSQPSENIHADAGAAQPRSISAFRFWDGLLFRLFVPKAAIVAMFVFAQFADTFTGSAFSRLLKLTAVIIAVGFVIDFSWLLLASRVRHWITSPQLLMRINRVLALVLVAVVFWVVLR